jgi:hypothetical protein
LFDPFTVTALPMTAVSTVVFIPLSTMPPPATTAPLKKASVWFQDDGLDV